MMYLENVLMTLVDKADVRVSLSSYTLYNDDEFRMQDGCGNHHTCNWLDAIKLRGLQKIFRVADIDCIFEGSYMDQPQWIITLENKKDEMTKVLAYESNEAAIRNCFNY